MQFTVYALPVEPLKEGESNYNQYTGEFKNFICADRGFKVGDKVYWFDPEAVTSCFTNIIDVKIGELDEDGRAEVRFLLFDGGTEVTLDELIKVVAEVSPAATWVKEWDEIEEEDIQIKQFSEDDDLSETDTPVTVKYIALVKGPCGHFH